MKLAISTSSMRRMAWKQCRSCSPELQLDVPRLAGEPATQRMYVLAAGFEQARHGSCANQSTCRSGRSLRSSREIAISRRPCPRPIGEER